MQTNTPGPRFFGGDASNLGHVKALPVTTFKALVDRYFSNAVAVNVTKEQFAAMPKAERQARKRVPYTTPATFETSPANRRLENAKPCNLIFLDIDVEADKDGNVLSLPAKPYHDHPRTLFSQLAPFNFVLHKTASSTPDAPRIRVMVEAHEIPVKSYKFAVAFVAKMLGLTNFKGIKESRVAVQPMFRPVIFAGSDELTDHPVLAARADGRAITMLDVESGLEIEADATEGMATEPDEIEFTGDALDYLRPPVPEITLEDCREALRHVEPDLDYPDWLEIAASLRHQFTGEDAPRAFDLFDDWSGRGTKYVGKEDTQAKWRSLRASPADRLPITIRSLLRMATLAGWEGREVRAKCFKATLEWIKGRTDSGDLMHKALGKIMATPMISKAEEEALLNEVVRVAKSALGLKLTITALRKDLKELTKRIQATKSDKDRETPGWALGLCYVSATNQFYRQSTRERYSPESLDLTFGKHLLPSDGMLAEAGATDSLKAAAMPILRPRDYLLNLEQVPIVYDFVYDPRFPNEVWVENQKRPCVNLYVRNHPEPDESQAEEAGKVVMAHLEKLLETPWHRKIVLDFLAHVVQFPGKKIRWAVLLQGAEGCGKSSLSNLLSIALGPGHAKQIDAGALFQVWNDWAYGAQLISLEEVRVTGHNRHEVMNVLKPLITNDRISLNKRFEDNREVDNLANFILYTNHHDALALSSGDRRYFVLKSAMQTKAQVEALGPDYFPEFYRVLNTLAGGLRHFFENWEISEDFPVNGPAPRTHFLDELIEDSSSEAVAGCRDLLKDMAHPLIQPDLVSSTEMVNQLQGCAFKPTGQAVAAFLRGEGWVKVGRFTVDLDRHVLWVRVGSKLTSKAAIELANDRVENGCHDEEDPLA